MHARIRGEHPAKYIFMSAKARAKKRGIFFSLSIADVENAIPKDRKCPILEIPLNIEKSRPTKNSMSLDRIIPSRGYVPGNIAIISYKANTIKNDQTDPEVFRKIADWLESHSRTPNLGSVDHDSQPMGICPRYFFTKRLKSLPG